MSKVGNSMDSYGVKILMAEIKQLDLPEDNKAAVYERMISSVIRLPQAIGQKVIQRQRKSETAQTKRFQLCFQMQRQRQQTQ